MSAVAEFDDQGCLHGAMGVLFDNSEAKRAQGLLDHKLRDEAVGKLAAGVAHDFNNLLSVIMGNLEFLRDVPDHPDRDEMIADALAGTRRGATLTQQLVSYWRRAQLSSQAQHLDGILRDMGDVFRRVLPPRIELMINIAPGLPTVMIDRRQLETAMINVVDNASDAINGVGQIHLSAAHPVRETPTGEETAPGGFVTLTDTDTGRGMGMGMDDATLSHVFEPFSPPNP